MRINPARVGRYARASTRWLRSRSGSRSGGIRRRRIREVPAARVALPESPHGLHPALSRLHVASARPARSASAGRAPRSPDRRQSRRRRVPGLGGCGDGGAEPSASARAAHRRPRSVPERVQQEILRRVPGPATGLMGGSLQRRRRGAVHARSRAARRAAGAAPRRRPDPGVSPRGCASHRRSPSRLAVARHGQARVFTRAAPRRARAARPRGVRWSL